MWLLRYHMIVYFPSRLSGFTFKLLAVWYVDLGYQTNNPGAGRWFLMALFLFKLISPVSANGLFLQGFRFCRLSLCLLSVIVHSDNGSTIVGNINFKPQEGVSFQSYRITEWFGLEGTLRSSSLHFWSVTSAYSWDGPDFVSQVVDHVQRSDAESRLFQLWMYFLGSLQQWQ